MSYDGSNIYMEKVLFNDPSTKLTEGLKVSHEPYPCKDDKYETCKNANKMCLHCIHAGKRQGIRIFANSKLVDNYKADTKLVNKYKNKMRQHMKKIGR